MNNEATFLQTSQRTHFIERFQGCMVGGALGDAIGEIMLYRAGCGCIPLNGTKLLINSTTLQHEIGAFLQLRYTDDTHMAIGIAEALSKSNSLDLNEIKRRFLINYQAEPGRGYGLGQTAILSLATFGSMTYDEAVHHVNAQYEGGGLQGNGAVMRTHPVALRFRKASNLYDIAVQVAALTHLHPVAQDAAAILSHGIAYLLGIHNLSLTNDGFLAHLSQHARTVIMRDKLKLVNKAIKNNTTPEEAIKQLGYGSEAHTSLPYAIYAFLRHPQSFEKCILTAVLHGGDADTLGAMAGALCGTRVGIQEIPQTWIRKLENAPYIQRLANKLA